MNAELVACADLPTGLTGSPIDFVDCLVGAPVTWHDAAYRGVLRDPAQAHLLARGWV